jgi:hypothetical protein
MGKYSDLQSRVFAVFDTLSWKLKKIAAYPSDFSPDSQAEEFIRITVIPSREALNLKSLSGICIIEIYTAFGAGPTRANAIADILDEFLVGKTLQNSVQFYNSTLSPKGQDKQNPLLARQDYTIPFNLFTEFN